MDHFLFYLEIVLSSLMIVSIIVETILSGSWNHIYFTKGLPLLVLRIPVSPHKKEIPSSSLLETQFRSSWGPSLVFRELGGDLYAFRERFFQFRLADSSPVMHGMLWFDHDTGQVVVKGFANWFILLFTLTALSVFHLFSQPLIAIGVLILALGVCYWVQYSRYSKVAAFAAQMWSQ